MTIKKLLKKNLRCRICLNESVSRQGLLTPGGILLQTAPELLLSLAGSHGSCGIRSGMLSNVSAALSIWDDVTGKALAAALLHNSFIASGNT